MNTQATQANGLKKAPGVEATTAQGRVYDIRTNKLTKRELAGKELFAKGKVEPYQPVITSAPEPIFVYAEVNGYRVTYEVVPPGITGTMRCECPDKKHNLNERELCKHLYAVRCYLEVNRDALTKKPGSEPAPQFKPLSKDARIGRLAVLNTATSILQSHGKPIVLRDVIELASQLEMWAHGKDKEVRVNITNGYIAEMFN